MRITKILAASAAAAAALTLSGCLREQNSESRDESDTSTESITESTVTIEPSPAPIEGIVIPTEFNSDDLFVQNFLNANAVSAEECSEWFRKTLYDPELDGEFKEMMFTFPDGGSPAPYYPVPERCPQTAAEMEKSLNRYFTSDVTADYMKSFCKGTVTENADGTYTVEIEGGASPARFIETDGRLYCADAESSTGINGVYWNTAKVVSQTDDTVEFTYIRDVYGELTESRGTLKKENGEWKLGRRLDG